MKITEEIRLFNQKKEKTFKKTEDEKNAVFGSMGIVREAGGFMAKKETKIEEAKHGIH
jgi:hypothetical protein